MGLGAQFVTCRLYSLRKWRDLSNYRVDIGCFAAMVNRGFGFTAGHKVSYHTVSADSLFIDSHDFPSTIHDSRTAALGIILANYELSR